MKNMLDRAMHHMEQDVSRAYTLTELRRAAGIAIRSQYRLSQQLLNSGMVVRDGGNYRVASHLVKGV
jgi:DNA-binding IclR family transcriptional regulator